MKQGRRLGHRAFTLLELLVVIGIIALLMTILLPALKTAKDTARSIVCVNNLKQIGTVIQLYANDHDNWLVPARPNMPGPVGTGGYYWPYPLSDLYLKPGPKLRFVNDVFRCAGVKEIIWEGQGMYGDYAMNYVYAPLYNEAVVTATLVRVDRIPANTMLLADCPLSSAEYAVAFHWQFWIPEMRHRNGINALCGDMHAAWVSHASFTNAYIYGINN